MASFTALPLPETVPVAGQVGALQRQADLAHYVNAVTAKAHRLIARSFDSKYINAAFAPNAGSVYIAKLDTPYGGSVSTIETVVATAGTGATALANCYAGLYDSTGARIAITAEQHASWNTGGRKSMLLVGAPYTLTGSYYYAAFLVGTQSTTALQWSESSGQGDATSLNFDQPTTTLGQWTAGQSQGDRADVSAIINWEP